MVMAFTQREFLFLEDLLHEEELQVRKFRAYSQQCQDPQLKQMLQSIAQRHEQHFNTLFQQLQQQSGTAYQPIASHAHVGAGAGVQQHAWNAPGY